MIINYENNQLITIKDSLPNYIGWGFSSWFRAEPVTKTYQSMISTGNINLLSNIVSEEDAMKLQSEHSTFDLATKIMLLELNRLESQQKMADLVDNILMNLNNND